MRKISYNLMILIFCCLTGLKAQFERTAGKIVADKQPGGIIETWDLEKTDIVEGNFFIHEDWFVGDVQLYDGRVLNSVPLKYNLRDDLLHILDENKEVRVINVAKIAGFEWFNFQEKRNDRYVNCLDYEINDSRLFGVARLLVEGKADLLLYRMLEIQKGMYSVIHDVGQKQDEYKINEYHYICVNDEIYQIKNKKSLEGVFGKHQQKMEKFIKANRYKIKNEEHLSEIVRYYNSL
jgi:hypothetical protein